LIEKIDIICRLGFISGFVGILSSSLPAASATSRVSTPSSGIPASTAGISSGAPVATAWTHGHRGLLRPHADIPTAAQGVGIDGNDSLGLGELAEVREPPHIVGILILSVQKNYDRIVLLLVVALRKMDHELTADVVNVDLFVGFLRVQMSCEKPREACDQNGSPA